MNATEKFFDDWKAGLNVETATELHKAVADMTTEYGLLLHETDPLGVFDLDNNKYFCLGDPCTTLKEQLECPTTEFELIPDDDDESEWDEKIQSEIGWHKIIY